MSKDTYNEKNLRYAFKIRTSRDDNWKEIEVENGVCDVDAVANEIVGRLIEKNRKVFFCVFIKPFDMLCRIERRIKDIAKKTETGTLDIRHIRCGRNEWLKLLIAGLFGGMISESLAMMCIEGKELQEMYQINNFEKAKAEIDKAHANIFYFSYFTNCEEEKNVIIHICDLAEFLEKECIFYLYMDLVGVEMDLYEDKKIIDRYCDSQEEVESIKKEINGSEVESLSEKSEKTTENYKAEGEYQTNARNIKELM